jgi:hypothetical protein
MSENQFAMVSKWMPNGNINEFVRKHSDANRFELVSFSFRFPSSPPLVDDYVISVVRRCHKRPDFYARSGDGPRGPQGGTFSKARVPLYL